MPTQPDPLPIPGKSPATLKTLRAILDFIRAMRTSPSLLPEEAIEWALLEQEFTIRTTTNEIHTLLEQEFTFRTNTYETHENE